MKTKCSPQQIQDVKAALQRGEKLKNVLECEPRELYNQGYTLYTNSDFKGALAAFMALIQVDPYLPDAWIGAGATLQAQKEHEAALAAYDFALRLNEDLTNALFYSGQCEYHLGNKEKAKDFFIKASLHEGQFGDQARLVLREGKL